MAVAVRGDEIGNTILIQSGHGGIRVMRFCRVGISVFSRRCSKELRAESRGSQNHGLFLRLPFL
jgi:hypothetical protein